MGTALKEYLLILPVALLVAYSQLMVKWRAAAMPEVTTAEFPRRLVSLLTDPLVITAYAAGLVASFGWLYVVSRLPLVVAFPVFIGLTFTLVIGGGTAFLAEPLTVPKILAIVLIISGIILGVVADAGS